MTLSHALLLLVAGAFGLILGSAVTALAHRLPRGQSWTHGRSRCPVCGHELGPLDLVPLLSWLRTLGRCRHCGVAVPLRYPLTEAVCASWAMLVADKVGLDWSLPFLALWGSLLVALVWIDLDFHLLPDALTFPGLLVGLAAMAPMGPRYWLYGALVGTVPLFLLLKFWERVLKVEGMGFGDIKLGLMFGVALGPWLTALAILLGALAGSLAGAVLMLRGKGHLRTALPFGAFLAPAAMAAFLWGEPVVNSYLTLIGRR